MKYLWALLFLLLPVVASAQGTQPLSATTLVLTNTTVDALHVGCAVGAAGNTCTGGIRGGTISVESTRAGGLAVGGFTNHAPDGLGVVIRAASGSSATLALQNVAGVPIWDVAGNGNMTVKGGATVGLSLDVAGPVTLAGATQVNNTLIVFKDYPANFVGSFVNTASNGLGLSIRGGNATALALSLKDFNNTENFTVTGGGSFVANGTGTVNGGLTVVGTTTVGGLRVNGVASIAGGGTDGNFSVGGVFSVSNKLTMSNTTGLLTIAGGINAADFVNVGGNLGVTGASTMTGAVTMSNSLGVNLDIASSNSVRATLDLVAGRNLSVTGTSSLSTLNVGGLSTLSGVTINGVVSAPAMPRFAGRNSAPVSIPANAPTVLTWDTHEVNNSSIYAGGALVIPSAGFWIIGVSNLLVDGITDAGTVSVVEVWKNGAAMAVGCGNGASGPSTPVLSVTCGIQLAAADQITAVARQSSPAANNIIYHTNLARFWAVKVW